MLFDVTVTRPTRVCSLLNTVSETSDWSFPSGFLQGNDSCDLTEIFLAVVWVTGTFRLFGKLKVCF